MSIKLKRIVSTIITVCLTAALLITLTNITENKNSIKKYAQFFEQEADFDVLFMGSSKVINGVLPMELWNDYGIVSYNMGGHANTLPTSYWVLRNALDYTTPKCVVIDCFGYGSSDYISSNFYYAHLSFDAFPLSVNKIRGVCDLIEPTQEENVQAKRMELLWNFSIYHSRWSSLEKNDFSPRFTYQKGAEPRVNVSVPNEMAVVSPDARLESDTLGKEYLIKMITMCQERGIQVLLFHSPYPADEKDLISANSVQDVAAEYGVQYVNFMNMDLVDYQTDMNDPSSHLNPLGARKITGYLGKLLREEYGIPDRRNDTAYGNWAADEENYAMEKLALFTEETTEKSIWLLLTDRDYDFVAGIRGSGEKRDSQTRKLMAYAGLQPEQMTDGGYVVADRSTDTIMYIDQESLLKAPVDTPLGLLALQQSDQETTVMLDGEPIWPAASEASEQPALTVAVFDREKGLSTWAVGDF